MDLLVFGKNHGDSGPTRFNRGLTKSLNRLGYNVEFIWFGDREDPPDSGINYHRLQDPPQSVLEWLRMYRQAREIVQERTYDLFHAIERYPYGADVQTIQATSDLYMMWRLCPNWRPKIRSLAGDVLLNWRVRGGAAKSDLIVSTSPETTKQLESLWRLSPDYTVPLGIDEEIRTQPNAVSDPPRILLVGRLSRRKGYDRLLKHLDPNDPSYEVRIAGGIRDEAYATEVLEGWWDQYLGYISREELLSQYRQADIVLIPSYLENFSVVALEAIAHGCAVVISERCGFAQYDYISEENGVFVESDGKELADRTIDLVNDSSLPQFKQNAYELSGRFTWASVAEQYVDIYRSVLES